jgi:hypothetical protein
VAPELDGSEFSPIIHIKTGPIPNENRVTEQVTIGVDQINVADERKPEVNVLA